MPAFATCGFSEHPYDDEALRRAAETVAGLGVETYCIFARGDADDHSPAGEPTAATAVRFLRRLTPLLRVPLAQNRTRRNHMAELTVLDAKVAEVPGLAQAAQGADRQGVELVEDDRAALRARPREAGGGRDRGALTTQYVEDLDGKKTAVLDKARETKQEARR